MIYAEILCSGKGSRMGATNMPKQFMLLDNKPIVIHTLEQFLLVPTIDKILIVVSNEWIAHMNDLILKYIPKGFHDKIHTCCGGKDRNESMINGIKYIESNFKINIYDIIVTHDAVRPFVTPRIIKENIDGAIKFGATDTVIPSYDTIVKSNDRNYISEIPNREYMFLGQTPQAFNILDLKNTYESLTENEKEILTDCAKIYTLKNKSVKLITGDPINIKITTMHDLKIANFLLKEGKPND